MTTNDPKMTINYMSNIQIYYTQFNKKLSDQFCNDYLSSLPLSFRDKNVKYRRWQDRHSNLFGKLLLLAALKNYGYSDKILNEIKYDQYSRPFIEGNIDFNISHSGEYVLCAIGKGIRLGVDVEEIKKIHFDDFRPVMTQDQWQNIEQTADSTLSFFKYWTIKESVIKADSRGLSIPLLDIHVKNNKICYDDQTWFLNELHIDKRYSAFLATDKQDINIKIKYIDFSKTREWNTEHKERNQESGDWSRELITNDLLMTANENKWQCNDVFDK